MKRSLLSLLLLFQMSLLNAQDLGYIGFGYNVCYSRMGGLNNWVNAYNNSPNKIGGLVVTQSFKKFHILPGIHFAIGVNVSPKRVVEIRYTRRSFTAEALLNDPATSTDYSVEVKYTMPTFGVSTYTITKTSNKVDIGFGYALDFNGGKLERRFKNFGTGFVADWIFVEKYFNLAATGYMQINTYPLGKSFPLRLCFRPYYQMNLKRRDFEELDRQVKNVFDDRKLKSTASNIGIEAVLCIGINKAMFKTRPKRIVVKNDKADPVTPKPVKDEITSGFIIKGKVLSKKDNSPIAGAKVEITDPTGKVLGSAVSESDGSYKVQLQEGTNFNITAQNKGFLTNHEEAKIEAETSSVEKDVLLEPIEVGTSVNLKNVLFEKGTSKLIENSYPELDRLVQFMNENPSVVIELGGHTSNEGDAKLNTKLSAERVKVVRDYLMSKGLNGSRIDVKAYGPTKPLYKNDTEEHRRMNRRVEFTILKN
jgi:outer membrane protein OmpA-like peptidoglycan-associated protein